MKKFKSWDDWEVSVKADWERASLSEKFKLIIGAAGLRPSESTDDQHAKFVSLGREIELEMKSIVGFLAPDIDKYTNPER